ncbi:MAG TPA: hypothetical protein VFK33_05270, partial [Bacillales bacterium]|nr:hypothetical protein [Bacillales bacterium]
MPYYYDPYLPQSGWWQQGQGGNNESFTGEEGSRRQGNGSQGHGSAGTQASGMGTQTPGGMYGSSMPYSQVIPSPSQGPGSVQGYSYLNPAALYPGASQETQ